MKILILIFLFINLFIYLLGCFVNASFNLAEWSENSRNTAVFMSSIFLVIYTLVITKSKSFTND